MRKCDICSTNIPIGSDRCPNCGYQYKPERKLDGTREKYMSQFQPHPSPLDGLKKGEIPDFSKVYTGLKDTINKSTVKTVRKKRSAIIIIPIIILFMIISTFIFGISYGVTQIFDDFDSYFDSDFDDYYVDYGWYHSLEELEEFYPQVYDKVQPYYSYVYNLVDEFSEFDISEMYSVEDDELDYGSIDGSVYLNDLYVYVAAHYDYDHWYELFQTDLHVGDNLELGVNQNVINALAYLTGVDSNQIQKFLENFTQTCEEGLTYKYIYADDGGTFYFSYNDGFIHYEYENIIEGIE